jgi:hypothetical protein
MRAEREDIEETIDIEAQNGGKKKFTTYDM